MKCTAVFTGVGRAKKSWRVESIGAPTDPELLRSIKKQRALGSRDVDIWWDDDGIHGGVFVGGFRRVGSIELVWSQEEEEGK